MIIRLAEPADAEGGAALHLACWREAYAGIVEPQRLAEITGDLDGTVEHWRAMIAVSRRWLAEENGELVGFAAAGPNDETDLDVTSKLYAIYVRKAYWGTGLGHRLITQAIGNDDAALWVFRDNGRAVDFYARQGFVADGREQVEPEFGAPEIRMVRRRAQTTEAILP